MVELNFACEIVSLILRHKTMRRCAKIKSSTNHYSDTYQNAYNVDLTYLTIQTSVTFHIDIDTGRPPVYTRAVGAFKSVTRARIAPCRVLV